MNRKIILSSLVAGVSVIIFSAASVLNSTGYSYATGSPSDGMSCNSCHSGGSSTPTSTLTFSPVLASGTRYVAGQTYTLTLNESGYSHWGFDMEIMNTNSSSGTTDAGTMTALSTNCKKSGSGPTNITHKATISSSTSAQIKWVAPTSGTAYVYYSVLGVNNDGNTTGDKVKTYTLTLTQSPTGIVSHTEDKANLTLYPNPAKDNLHISYELTERSNVSVKLYDLNGEQVADLLNETQDMGKQSIDTHLPAGLAKGFYMVKLDINGRLSTQKLLIY